jgi:transposase-like protein
LTGTAAAKKFGISTLTFYTWRKKAGKTRKPLAAGRAANLGTGVTVQLRSQIRETLRAMIPDIVREEVQAAVTGVFGMRPRRRG